MERETASKRSRGPIDFSSVTLSKRRCRSYSPSVPINWMGPHPYCLRSLDGSSGAVSLAATPFVLIGVFLSKVDLPFGRIPSSRTGVRLNFGLNVHVARVVRASDHRPGGVVFVVP